MSKEIKEKIEELDTRRAELLRAICEDDSLWNSNIIVQLVNEIRAITKILRILRGDEGRGYTY